MAWKNVQYKDGKMRTSNGGGGGASALTDLSDVSVSSPSNGQVLKYNNSTSKWENANESGGGHTYSTTEQVIGTWIDGKPLYEKSFQFSNYIAIPTKSWTTIMDVSSLNISKLIHCDFIDMEGVYWSGALNRISSGNLQSYAFEGWPVKEVTLKYTKTTDV